MENVINNYTKSPLPVMVEGMTSVSALINSVLSGKNTRRILQVLVSNEAIKSKRRETAFLRAKAGVLGYCFSVVPVGEIDGLAEGKTHGGIIALCTERHLPALVAENLPELGFFVLLEGIEDPFNFGYTVRSLYAAGADGIVLGRRNWMSAASTVIRASAGTTELIDMYEEDPVKAVNIFKSRGYRIISAGIRDSVSLYEADLRLPLLLIIGGEKRGISRRLLELSDQIVRIDYGRKFMGSLTTSAAAAVFAFEIMRRGR